MANYKSQYTGEQIDEAIGKVLNARNIYNYDGTVIIEKAESVLGLRRFKGVLTSTDSVNANVDYTVNGITYNKIIADFDGGIYCVIFQNTETESVAYAYFSEAVAEQDIVKGWQNEAYRDTNVISCDDETAKAWLLANTEGVSV